MTTPPPRDHSTSADLLAQLDSLLALKAGPRIEPLTRFARMLVTDSAASAIVRERTVAALLALLDGFAGNGRQRMEMGEALGLLGDPRLRSPEQSDYWVSCKVDGGRDLLVGRFAVTTAEFRAWADNGGYDDTSVWSEEGLAWLAGQPLRWTTLAEDPEAAHLVVPNQPVAGVTWWEAEAYARAHNARLLSEDEHRAICRGAEKRPYPWGAPFGDGNANTKEEALGRPCAAGVFAADCTPEGVYDMAGNMGCWLSDGVEDGRRLLHPGSWARPSIAAWAKAIEMAAADTRSADLGLRLARDPS